MYQALIYLGRTGLNSNIKILSKNIIKGDRLAIARAMTIIENEKVNSHDLLNLLYSQTGNAYRIGITGPPGAGKSTLTSQLTKIFRKEQKTVGIIAVDPTSPFTGGAILGDRIRMTDHTLDKGVFIRSMATRGNSGGLARQASEVADVLDAAGFDFIIFETVGVGQVELDIAAATDTTIVMIVPESGDIIQGLKSGLMEIADIFILNKSDRPGADRMQKDIEYVLHLREPGGIWPPKVLQTIATDNSGIEGLRDELEKHKSVMLSEDLLEKKRNNRLKGQIELIIRERIEEQFWNEQRLKMLQDYLKNNKDKISPYLLAERMLEKIRKTL